MATQDRSLNRYQSPMGRCVATALVIVSGFHLAAQKPSEIDYSIHLSPAFTSSEAKFVREALQANDPACVIWPDEATQRVVVRTTMPLERAVLQQQIAPAGLSVLSIDLLLPVDPQERKAMIMAAAGFPRFNYTGNLELDQSHYAAAKATWIDADPARYAEMIRALNAGPTEAR